ncbi:MAG: ABC transporter permease, partial [Cyanobacteria bacterium P01_F01_bin.86]
MTTTSPIAAPQLLKNRAVQRFLESTSGLVGLGLTVFIVLAAVLAPVLNPYDPASDRNYALRLNGPSLEHWFGTEGLGRDILTLVWYGLRTSLVIGLVSVLIGMVIGV